MGRITTPSNAWEPLEPRRHLAAGSWPLSIRTVETSAGTELRVTGTAGHDRIAVRTTDSGYVLSNKGGFSQRVDGSFARVVVNGARGDDRIIVDVPIDAAIYGSNGNDVINGGSGRDSIYGGNGKDRILGGGGDDTIVSIGDSRYDRSSGGPGLDAFWVDDRATEVVTDISDEETAAGAVHRVGGFAPVDTPELPATETSNHLVGQNLPDPLAHEGESYASFSDQPLFTGDGPTAEDAIQGSVGDCYLHVTLAAVAKMNPHRIEQSVAAMGDGTYAVRLWNDGTEVYYRVDGDLPAYDDGSPIYAKLGPGGALWAPLIEKAFAFFRGGAGTYAAIHAGWMNEGFEALGITDVKTLDDADSPEALLEFIDAQLAGGHAITFATDEVDDDLPLLEGHAYSIESVYIDETGRPTSLRMRNPWGADGAGSDGANDGYVTLSAAEALRGMSALVYAKV